MLNIYQYSKKNHKTLVQLIKNHLKEDCMIDIVDNTGYNVKFIVSCAKFKLVIYIDYLNKETRISLKESVNTISFIVLIECLLDNYYLSKRFFVKKESTRELCLYDLNTLKQMSNAEELDSDELLGRCIEIIVYMIQ